jgi:hypothetical protein
VNVEKPHGTTQPNRALLERDLATVLQRLLSSVAWMREWQMERPCAGGEAFDFRCFGPMPETRNASLFVVCRTLNFQPSQFKAIADRPVPHTSLGPCARVLAAPRVSSRMAELCSAHGWSWYDLAGNCRLEVPGLFLIERAGNRPVEPRPRTSANLATAEASAVVRALLVQENADRRWTQRGIAAHLAAEVPQAAAPSLGLVNKVVRHLQELDCLEPQPGSGFRVCRHEVLLDAWRDAYRFDRHVRREYATSLHREDVNSRLGRFERGAPGRAVYAAFTAAPRERPSPLDNRTWLYVDPNAEDELASALDATGVDAGGNLVVLLAADPWVFYGREVSPNQLGATHPVQTFVDLVSVGGSGLAAATDLFERRLKPGWVVSPAAATDSSKDVAPAPAAPEQLGGSWWL